MCVCEICVLFCSTVIEEANWLSLPKDLQQPGNGFDAVICLGNSFAHLPDFKGKVAQKPERSSRAQKRYLMLLEGIGRRRQLASAREIPTGQKGLQEKKTIQKSQSRVRDPEAKNGQSKEPSSDGSGSSSASGRHHHLLQIWREKEATVCHTYSSEIQKF